MNKIIKTVLLAWVFSVIAIINVVTVKAASYEIEKNDIITQANEIDVNEDVSGVISAWKDEDYYKITLSEPSKLNLNFQHQVINDSNDNWILKLLYYDSSTGESTTYLRVCSTGNSTNVSSCNIGLPDGVYYVCVSGLSSYNYGEKQSYTLRVNATVTGEWEREENDTIYTANPQTVNNIVRGTIRTSYSDDDEDWYRFEVPENGVVSISFDHEVVQDTNDLWQITFVSLDENTGEKDTYLSVYSSGTSTSVSSENYGLSKGTYYVRVRGCSSYNYSEADYSLRLNYIQTDAWETSPNGTIYTANEISLGKYFSGSITYEDNEDWYSFTVGKTGMIWVNFNHNLINTQNTCWRVGLYTLNNTTGQKTCVHDMDSAGTKTKGGFWYVGLPAGKYYLCVKKYQDDARGVDYNIKVSLKTYRKAKTTSNIYKEKSNSRSKKIKLSKGKKYIYISDASDGWSKVYYKNKFYYAINDALGVKGKSSLPTKAVFQKNYAVKKVYFARSMTSSKKNRLKKLKKGKKVQLLSPKKNGWYWVKLGSKLGYVKGKYLK